MSKKSGIVKFSDMRERAESFTKLMSEMRNKFSDMSITCQGKSFPANMTFLSAHSEVFAAMLAHDTKEAKECNIEIVDAEPDTVEAFLAFLYEFKLPPLNVEMAANLMLMGDKYNVPSLVAGCRSYFSKNLREDDLVKVAILGYLCKEDGVKDNAISMMGKIVGPLSTLKDWKKLEGHPALALEIVDRVTRMKQQEMEKMKVELEKAGEQKARLHSTIRQDRQKLREQEQRHSEEIQRLKPVDFMDLCLANLDRVNQAQTQIQRVYGWSSGDVTDQNL